MRQVRNRIATGVLLFSILFPQLHAETLDQHDQRMQWWREARFGMFIHWGLYAVPAGEYDGKSVDGIGEWIMHFARIPRAEYEQFAAQFNPQNFNADEWVRMAKYAGMKYIVVATKHHDGFCMFDASNSTYDIVDAAPYGKDALREISEACRRHRIIFCTYYSIMDWHHPSQLPASEENGRPVWSPSRMVEEKKAEYVQYMKEHLRQLIVEYHTHLLWFDGEWPDWWTDSDARELYQWLRSLNPDLIVNNRIGKGRKGFTGFTEDGFFAGDFGTPEQEIPATGVNIDWESCMTMNGTWGYKSSDHNWKTAETLIRNLIDVVSKGGNYLLNIGPDAQGTVPQESVQRLRDIGRWMSVNGESIYGTQAALFRPEWGRVTRRNGALYLHVFDWPADGKLTIPALQNRFSRASLLARPEVSLAVETGSENWVITLPLSAIDPVATVVALDVDGVPELKEGLQ